MERIQENVGKNRRQKDEHHLDKKNDRKEKRKKQKKERDTQEKGTKKEKKKMEDDEDKAQYLEQKKPKEKKREKGSEGALCLETRQGLFTVDGLSSVCLADVWLSPFSAGALVFIFDLCTLEKIV